jgi:NAD(P)-dependent dehydrogenase (short-subunit alcohol dehydrogenase family)
MKILVIGGSGGIGEATVRLLSGDGHELSFTYRSNSTTAEAIEKSTGAGKIHYDFSSEDAVSELSRRVTSDNYEGLVYAAAEKFPRELILKTDAKTYLEYINGSLNGYFQISKAFALSIKTRKVSGAIVNILSSVVLDTPPAKQACYVSAKYALLGLTRCQAVEFGAFGVRVNSVSPGMTQTKFNSDLPERFLEIYAESLPLGRLLTPDEVAQAVRALLLPEASNLRGLNVPVMGGAGQ